MSKNRAATGQSQGGNWAVTVVQIKGHRPISRMLPAAAALVAAMITGDRAVIGR